MSKVWFAKKQNGEVITLTEIEALTHFERNNIATRMRLSFIGTSDGSKMAEAKLKAGAFMDSKIEEIYTNYRTMSKEERGLAKLNIQEKFAKELKEIIDDGFNQELEQAKSNGVQRPDPTLRIITKKDGGNATGLERQKIINSIA